MIQQIGAPNGVVKRTNVQQVMANQSWPASFDGGQLAAWHSPAFGYFNSNQAEVCGSASRVGIDNTCFAGGPVTPAMLSAPFSRNPGPYNMDNGQYLYKLTQPVPPLTGMSTADVLVRDKDM